MTTDVHYFEQKNQQFFQNKGKKLKKKINLEKKEYGLNQRTVLTNFINLIESQKKKKTLLYFKDMW